MTVLYWLLIPVLGFLVGFVLDYVFLVKYPDEIPTIRYSRGFWSHVRSNIGYFTSQKRWIQDGYNKVETGLFHSLVHDSAIKDKTIY